MPKKNIEMNLFPEMFTGQERQVLVRGELEAAGFLFPTGVAGLRLSNSLGSLVMLPYQGQQIWSAEFGGRNLTFKSMVTQPRSGVPFLETFGGFMQHCGATAMGGPSPEDTHPLHGELPNAPYDQAKLILGEDERGAFIGLTGSYQYSVAFSFNYLAEPVVRLYAGSSLFSVQMQITNLKATPMELMYLAHVNFKPVDYGRLVYTAQYNPESVRVRAGIPAHITPLPGYEEFLAELAANPTLHHELKPELAFDPEAAIFIDYQADEDGWAHSMQVHPDGYADYVSHRPGQLPRATRWLSRTPDQDAVAIVEPGTAEPEGYLAEKAKGNLYILEPKGIFTADLLVGSLEAAEAARMEKKIDKLMGR